MRGVDPVGYIRADRPAPRGLLRLPADRPARGDLLLLPLPRPPGVRGAPARPARRGADQELRRLRDRLLAARGRWRWTSSRSSCRAGWATSSRRRSRCSSSGRGRAFPAAPTSRRGPDRAPGRAEGVRRDQPEGVRRPGLRDPGRLRRAPAGRRRRGARPPKDAPRDRLPPPLPRHAHALLDPPAQPLPAEVPRPARPLLRGRLRRLPARDPDQQHRRELRHRVGRLLDRLPRPPRVRGRGARPGPRR